MAGFKTHVTTSTLLGVGYGGLGFVQFGLPWEQCLLATGLCGVSGMLPDLDSDTGVPLRESLCFAAAVIPMMLIDRFHSMHMSADGMILATVAIYLLVRFVFGKALKAYTVHRGMFHSIPAVAIFGEVCFLACGGEDLGRRFYLSFAVVAGAMSHLVLDEIYSVNLKNLRIKKSFGTALKFFSKGRTWPNISAYGKLILFSYLVICDPIWNDKSPTNSLNDDVPRAERQEFNGPGGFLNTLFHGENKPKRDDDPSLAGGSSETRR